MTFPALLYIVTLYVVVIHAIVAGVSETANRFTSRLHAWGHAWAVITTFVIGAGLRNFGIQTIVLLFLIGGFV